MFYLVAVEVVGPVHLAHLLVDVVGAFCLEMNDGLENADGRVQLEVGAIHDFLVASERYHASADLHVVGSQFN